jgi:6,7-dimethyl-8-ribityllumazine synthase
MNTSAKEFIATVEKDKIGNIHEIAKDLEKQEGVKVKSVLTMLGIITGITDNFEVVKKFVSKGLRTVEEGKTVHAV